MYFSGRTTAGGKLFRGCVTAPTVEAIDGQSLGIGTLGLNPGGIMVRPVSIMWCPAEWSFEGWLSDRHKAHKWLR